MQELLRFIRCPITRTQLRLQVLTTETKIFRDKPKEIIKTGILFNSDNHWFYPIINGIPRLTIEAFDDYQSFLKFHIPDYDKKRTFLLDHFGELIKTVKVKNKNTKQSFTKEWSQFNYEKDKTWNASNSEMLERFFEETNETRESIQNKLILDAGCGNGLLDQLIAECGATVLAMDFSLSVERAFAKNDHPCVFFIQGDVQFPPFAFNTFNIVHSSGVLHHTQNTELSLSCLEPCVMRNGKLSVWLYHPRNNAIHKAFNLFRILTLKIPLIFQYYIYKTVLFPPIFLLKRLKGSKQNKREIMIDILDQFSPEFRHEHTPGEVRSWFTKRNYQNVKITTVNQFGFNIIGIKSTSR